MACTDAAGTSTSGQNSGCAREGKSGGAVACLWLVGWVGELHSCESPSSRFFCLIIIRIRPIEIMARYKLSVSCPLSARCRLVASSPLPSAQACPKKANARQGDYKAKTKERTKESHPQIQLRFRGRHEGGRGKKQRLFLTRGTQLLGLHPPLLFSFSPFSPFPF
jgi:hypothetical protein